MVTDLISYAKWDDSESGILDSTGLRFFIKITFCEKPRCRVKSHLIVMHGRKQAVRWLTMGLFSEFLATQVMMLAREG